VEFQPWIGIPLKKERNPASWLSVSTFMPAALKGGSPIALSLFASMEPSKKNWSLNSTGLSP